MKRGDKALLVIILCLVALGLLPRLLSTASVDRMVVIRVDGKVYQRVSLQGRPDRTIEVKAAGGGINLVRIQDGKVSVISANCRGQTCVKSAPISRIGETIACLPHHLVISIEGIAGADQGGIDGLSY